MPVYEYECQRCGETFEIQRGVTQHDQKATCPKCRAANCRQVFSGFARLGPSSGHDRVGPVFPT